MRSLVAIEVAREEHHARDLASHQRALVTHPHHNYYEGRETTDLTSWLSYFVGVLAEAIGETRLAAERTAGRPALGEAALLRRLGPRARAVLGLFADQETISSRQVAHLLGHSERMDRMLVAGWVEDGWLEVADPSRRARAYSSSAMYRQFIGNREAGDPSPLPE